MYMQVFHAHLILLRFASISGVALGGRLLTAHPLTESVQPSLALGHELVLSPWALCQVNHVLGVLGASTVHLHRLYVSIEVVH